MFFDLYIKFINFNQNISCACCIADNDEIENKKMDIFYSKIYDATTLEIIEDLVKTCNGNHTKSEEENYFKVKNIKNHKTYKIANKKLKIDVNKPIEYQFKEMIDFINKHFQDEFQTTFKFLYNILDLNEILMHNFRIISFSTTERYDLNSLKHKYSDSDVYNYLKEIYNKSHLCKHYDKIAPLKTLSVLERKNRIIEFCKMLKNIDVHINDINDIIESIRTEMNNNQIVYNFFVNYVYYCTFKELILKTLNENKNTDSKKTKELYDLKNNLNFFDLTANSIETLKFKRIRNLFEIHFKTLDKIYVEIRKYKNL
ncbi:hypothetical protein EHP00_883 [Ecytonucleospora hepatopenaei]|uniref:Uncharacterized protein n=1 Tax=Ecytonucleospora hepatopenaei TaxID=646526 RepID=A0A1W0E3Z3_9MICR|nr:hypothetical protein EHP00_883 [Ecytonucleospora hepatopenaei]